MEAAARRSSSPPSGHGNGSHVAPHYQGQTKGPLSWDDCIAMARQQNQGLVSDAGKHVVPADLHPGNAEAIAGVLRDAGYAVTTATVDVSSRDRSRPRRRPSSPSTS